MKTFQILNAQPILQKLADAELPIGTAVILLKALQEIVPVTELFEKRRQALFETYGEQDGEQLIVSPENKDAFVAALNKETDADIDIDFKQISIESLGTDVKISASELSVVSWLFTDFNTEAE